MISYKKKMSSYIVLLGLIAFLCGNSTIVAQSRADIVKMADIISREKNLKVEAWSVTAREMVRSETGDEDFYRIFGTLEQLLPSYNWEQDHRRAEMKVRGIRHDARQGLTETVQVMSGLENGRTVTYVTYEVKGESWGKSSLAFFEKNYKTRINDIFRGKPLIFSCITGYISDNMDTILSSETARLLGVFKGKEIESVKETDFVSMTGKTELFEQPLTENQLNLQLALRTDRLSGKTAFTVGTPIITFEY